jgi:hypothetical protein
MVLPSKRFRGFTVVELAFTFARVCDIAVLGGFTPCYLAQPTFLVWNRWESYIQQFFTGISTLFGFLVEYLCNPLLDEVERVSSSIHLPVFMVISPTSD